MSKQQVILQEGFVKESLSNSKFKVELDAGVDIICTLSGK